MCLLLMCHVLAALVALGAPNSADAGQEKSSSTDGIWAQLPHDETWPSARYAHSAIYDPIRDRMLVFGGFPLSNADAVWELALGSPMVWSELVPPGTGPGPLQDHSAVYDPAADRMLVFGGSNSGGLQNSVWELSLAGAPTWTLLTTSGTPPTPRRAHAAVFDSLRNRMIVFGGYTEVGGTACLNDVYELSLNGTPTWSPVTTSGQGPRERMGHTAILDPSQDRMVIFGGGAVCASSTFFNDTWTLTLSGSPTWDSLAIASPPPARLRHSAIYDHALDRMVVCSGDTSAFQAWPYFNDTWSLSLGPTPHWTELQPSGTIPGSRTHHSALYDPIRGRMMVFGGWAPNALDEVWMLTWGAPGPPLCSARNEIDSYHYGIGTATFDAWQSIGPPDGRGTPIGLGGELTLRFTHNIIDGPGPDLRVYELGHSGPPAIDENFGVAVSLDGSSWTDLGEGPGDVVDFDLGSAGVSSARFVRITDREPMEQTPPFDPTVLGPDIDAVVALHCGNFETSCWNNVDDDGDGYVDCFDDDCRVDADQDGHLGPPCGNDCNDADGTIQAGQTEDCRNGEDDDCDGLVDCDDLDCHSFIDSDGDTVADCDDGCAYPDDPCQPRLADWFVLQRGTPDRSYKLDIAVAADIGWPGDDYLNSQLPVEIDEMADAFMTLPGVSAFSDRITFWRCLQKVHTTRDGTQDIYKEVSEAATLFQIEAVLIRRPGNSCDPDDPLLHCYSFGWLETGYSVTSVDAHNDMFTTLHELGHSVFGLTDEYPDRCGGAACSKRASKSPEGRFGIQNVWRDSLVCDSLRSFWAFPAPCYRFCPPATITRLGNQENPNLMRARCPDEGWGDISVDGYGDAGNLRVIQLLMAHGAGSASKPQISHPESVSSGRTMTLIVDLSPTAGAIDSICIERAESPLLPPASVPVYLQVLDSQGSILGENFVWDPRDRSPEETGRGAFVVQHPNDGQRWRVVDRNDSTLVQGSLGRAFLDYCERINFTDDECFRQDADRDSIPDAYDNCPTSYNPDQLDLNGNGIGRECDPTNVAQPETLPTRFYLAQNRPNPFRRVTDIRFVLPAEDRVRVRVFSVSGREVASVMDVRLGAGPHIATWDGRDSAGRRVAAGLYLYHLETSRGSQARKLVLLPE